MCLKWQHHKYIKESEIYRRKKRKRYQTKPPKTLNKIYEKENQTHF